MGLTSRGAVPRSWDPLPSSTQWLSTHSLSQPINIFNKSPSPPPGPLHRNPLTTKSYVPPEGELSWATCSSHKVLIKKMKEYYIPTHHALVHPYVSSLNTLCWFQVREASITTLVDVYRHVGERVRADLGKRGLPAARWVTGRAMHHSALHGGHRDRGGARAAYKAAGAGGEESERESIGCFHPSLVVPVASVVHRMLGVSLASVNAGWGHASCVVHIKARLFPAYTHCLSLWEW